MKITTQFDYAVVDGAMGKMLRFFCAHREEHDRSRACVQAFFSYFFLPHTAATKFLCSHLVASIFLILSLDCREKHITMKSVREKHFKRCALSETNHVVAKKNTLDALRHLACDVFSSSFFILLSFFLFIPFTHNDNTPAD